MTFAYTNSVKQYSATTLLVVDLLWRRTYQCKEKIAIKCAFPFLIEKRLGFCHSENKISDIVYENEKSMRSEEVIHSELMRIWNTMLECMYIGCHTSGILPGGLNVPQSLICIKIWLGYLITVVHKLGWKKLELLRWSFAKSKMGCFTSSKRSKCGFRTRSHCTY
jgi:hypothetical protein